MTAEKWIEAGARAAYNVCADGDVPSWEATSDDNRQMWREETRACLTAILAAAEADGVVMTRVPDEKQAEPDDYTADERKQGWHDGFGFCRAAVLAGKVVL